MAPAGRENLCPGGIIKIYMKDFMTYNEAIVRPGKHFNVVIGPNGSGKSSVVAALALALGGNHKTMGKEEGGIAQFVRHGCQQAIIAVELYDPEGPCVITRIISNQNRSTWKFNDNSLDERSIRRIIAKFNIQVDNLCQFLPQERVKSFSCMNAKELLKNTQRSIEDGSLLEKHDQLIQLRVNDKKLETQLDQCKKVLEMNTNSFKEMEDTVRGIKEREAMKKEIISLRQKKAWIVYDQTRDDYFGYKREAEEMEVKIKQITDNLKPLLHKISEKTLEIHKIKNTGRDNATKMNHCVRDFENLIDNIESCNENIKKIQQKAKDDIDQINERNKELSEVIKKKSKLENDLQVISNETGGEVMIKEKLNKFEKQIQNAKISQTAVETKLQGEFENINRIKSDIRIFENKKRELENINSKKMGKLQQMSKDAHNGVLWLQNNTDKFQKPIHLPMVLNLQVMEPKYAVYFENLISNNDLTAFICEDKEDMNLLLGYLREEQGLVINAVHSDPLVNYDTTPKIPLENIRQFGFEHYLISLIEAHPTIMNFLIKMYNIHNIPIGSNAIDDNLDHIPKEISRFFTTTTSYAVRVSRYTGAKSTRSSAIHSMNQLSLVLDRKGIQEAQANITRLTEQLQKLEDIVKEMQEKPAKFRKIIEEFREKKKSHTQELSQIIALTSQLRSTTEHLNRLQRDHRSVETIKNEAKHKIKEQLKKQMTFYKKCEHEYDACLTISKPIALYSIELKLAQADEEAAKDESRKLESELTDTRLAFEDQQRRVKQMKVETERLLIEAKKSTNGLKPEDRGFQEFEKVFSTLPMTLEQINEKISEIQAKVYCLRDNENGDNILQKYEDVQHQIRTLTTDIENLKVELATTRDEIEQLRCQWFPVLESWINQINEIFSKYLRKVGCVGEVKLHTGDNAANFDDYELKIFVKFRDVDSLQEFNSHRQSGGERALTTGIYLTSLQDLTTVPFRVVDEINQGMDGIYERHIFNILVGITAKPGGPQYFLLTPKLLPELSYEPHVDVQVVINGPFNVKFNGWNPKNYVEKLVATRERD